MKEALDLMVSIAKFLGDLAGNKWPFAVNLGFDGLMVKLFQHGVATPSVGSDEGLVVILWFVVAFICMWCFSFAIWTWLEYRD